MYVRMYIIVQIMQDKETEGFTSFSEISVYNEAPQTANADEIQPIIDFDSTEDILDFSLHSPTEASNSKSDKERPPRLRKMIAQEPVKLLELKQIIDNFVDDQVQHQNLEDDVDHETEIKSRRFQCIVCGSKFIRFAHLHRHMHLHTGAKPYICSVCRKRFSRSEYSSAHALSHRTDKEECIVCIKNPIYVSHDQTISVNNNDVNSVTNSATSLSNGTSTTDSLIVSIAIKHCSFLPQ